MRVHRLIWISLLTAAVGAGTCVFMVNWAERPSMATVNGEAVAEAIHAFCLDRQAKHQPLPTILTLGELVDARFLRESDLGSAEARDYQVPLDPNSPIVIMHFPHR